MIEFKLTDKHINDIQVDSIRRLIEKCKRAHFTDVHVRINGKWEKFEADWIKHIVEVEEKA